MERVASIECRKPREEKDGERGVGVVLVCRQVRGRVWREDCGRLFDLIIALYHRVTL